MSLRCHFDFTSISLWLHFDFTSVPFRRHFDFTSMSLQCQFAFTSVALRFHFNFTSISFRFHFDVTSVSLRFRFDFTSFSLRFHFQFKSISLRPHFHFTREEGNTPCRTRERGKLGEPTGTREMSTPPPLIWNRIPHGNQTAFTHERNETIFRLGSPHNIRFNNTYAIRQQLMKTKTYQVIHMLAIGHMQNVWLRLRRNTCDNESGGQHCFANMDCSSWRLKAGGWRLKAEGPLGNWNAQSLQWLRRDIHWEWKMQDPTPARPYNPQLFKTNTTQIHINNTIHIQYKYNKNAILMQMKWTCNTNTVRFQYNCNLRTIQVQNKCARIRNQNWLPELTLQSWVGVWFGLFYCFE